MTTFAQWRSPNYRLGLSRAERAPKHYDLRLIDQFYAYCQAIARTERYREAAGQPRSVPWRTLWAIMIAGAFLGYYLFERIGVLTLPL